MLTCVGIGRNNHEAILNSLGQSLLGQASLDQTIPVQAGDTEHYPLQRFAEKGQNDVWGLQQLCEIVVNPVNSFPAPSSKIHPNDFVSSSFSVELHVRRIALDYLLYARKIYPSLTVSVIIFPFHYFL
jgi:hypothetical protein